LLVLRLQPLQRSKPQMTVSGLTNQSWLKNDHARQTGDICCTFNRFTTHNHY
jgi:hypothetical protein